MIETHTRLRFALAVLLASGCSVLNREGPAVTCEDLNYGLINACQDGIIASCLHGKIAYTLCDADACEESFQRPGAYRCGPDTDVPPSDE
jgi:hypothetical protein